MVDIAFLAGFVALLLAATLRIATSLLLPAIGELFAESSGILDVGIEGIMLVGALSAFATAYFTGNLWLGVLVAVALSVVVGSIMSVASVTLSGDQIVTGLAITIIGTGMTTFAYRQMFGFQPVPPHIQSFDVIQVPLLSQIPILGQILFQHYALTYLALILVPVSAYFLYRTPLGLKIRATGENPLAADMAGVRVDRVRHCCVLFGAAMAGLGGAFLSTAQFNMFLAGMTSFRGFIAIAIVMVGRWNPYRILAAALLFGGIEAFQLRLQATTSMFIPYQFALALPYVATIVVLAFVSRRNMPAWLARPYERSEA